MTVYVSSALGEIPATTIMRKLRAGMVRCFFVWARKGTSGPFELETSCFEWLKMI